MVALWSWLAGKKTYIMAVLYAVDAFGVQIGYWDDGGMRGTIEQIGIILALRSGIQASGPVVALVK